MNIVYKIFFKNHSMLKDYIICNSARSFIHFVIEIAGIIKSEAGSECSGGKEKAEARHILKY